jgi:nucleotide-binding universal stress UspA family protein
MVLEQGDARSDAPAFSTDFVEYVVINCACPVLVVPGSASGTESGASTGDRVLIAWNASSMAARAVRDAMPFLMRAGKVHVAIINSAPDTPGTEPGAQVAAYLARHGIDAEVVRQTVDTDAGSALLSLADRLSSTLLVMGCAAHQRGRGLLIGGATRTVLQSARIPVLMSH